MYGCCQVIDDPQIIKQIVEDMTKKYESSFENPCKYKLSQNRSEHDKAQIVDALNARGSQAMAAAIE